MNIEEEKLIAEYVGLKTQDGSTVPEIPRTDYFVDFLDTPTWVREDSLKFGSSWDWLMVALEKIHSPMRVKIYGIYRDIEGEDVNVLTHRSVRSRHYITLKIEYGRRFKEITEYKREGETMFEPTYRFVVEFIKWYNKHK